REGVQAGVASALRGHDYRRRAAVLLARPSVPRARPAVPADTFGRPNDTSDSEQAVAARVAALIHASTAGGPRGAGIGGEAGGGEPGVAGREGPGSRSAPSGEGAGPDYSMDPGLQGYISKLRQRIDDELQHAYPEWAIIAGRSGQVIFELR